MCRISGLGATSSAAWPRLNGLWPHTHQLENIARGLYLALCGIHTLIFLARTRNVDQRVLCWSIIALVVLSGVTVISRSTSLISIGSMSIATGLALLLPGDVQQSLQGQQSFLLMFLLALLVQPTRRVAIFTVGALTLAVVARWSLFGPAHGWGALDDSIIGVSIAMAVTVIRRAGVEGVMSADRSHAEVIRGDLRERMVVAEAQAVSATHQTLHDDALSALVAVGVAVDDDPTIRERILTVAIRLTRHGADPIDREETALAGLLGGLARESPLRVDLALDGSDTWPPINDVQVGVVRRAVSEALRNVERHADADTACLSAEFADGEFRVTVADKGRGFNSDDGPRWGRKHSLKEPVSSIGGSVRTSTGVGVGTTVIIQWPAPSAPRRTSNRTDEIYWATRAAAPDSIRVVLTALVWILATHGYLALRYSWGRPSALWQLVDGAILTTVSFIAVRHLRSAPFSRPWLAGLSMFAAACVAVGLALAGPGSLRYYDSFIVGMSCILLTAIAFFSSSLTTVLVVAPAAAVLTVATLLDPVAGWADSVGAYFALVAPPAAGYAIGAFLRRVARRSREEARRFAEVSGTAYRMRAEQAARLSLTPFTREVAAPWMLAVAAGTIPLGEPSTRARARQLAMQVRDELYLGGALDSALRGRVALARAHGIRVEFEAKDGSVLPEAAIPLRLLDRLMDHLEDITAVQVAVPTSTDPTWHLSMVGPADDALRRLDGALSTLECSLTQGTFATTIAGIIGRSPDGERLALNDSLPR